MWTPGLGGGWGWDGGGGAQLWLVSTAFPHLCSRAHVCMRVCVCVCVHVLRTQDSAEGHARLTT